MDNERFYIFSYPRTGSNLLMKILSLENQPNVAVPKNGGYFFAPLNLLRHDMGTNNVHVNNLTLEQQRKEQKCMERCFGDMVEHIHSAERDEKIILFKEHAHFLTDLVVKSKFLYGQDGLEDEEPWMTLSESADEARSADNLTIFSDSFLRSWKAVFLIRHPALAFPSYFRATVRADGEEFARSTQGKRICRSVMTLTWTRQLYDFYCDSIPKGDMDVAWPLVLDADDIMTDRSVLVKFAEIVGLDGSKLRFSWEKDTTDLRPGIKAFRSTIDGSTQIDTSKAGGDLDVDVEAENWCKEFGEEIGEMIELYVREAMSDYENLRNRRLVADDFINP